MPQSRFPKPTPQNPHQHLERRWQLIDLLTIVMLPGGIVACLPGLERAERAGAFVALFLLSLAAVWWGTTVAHTYGIRQAWKRVLIHVYSLAGFASLIMVLPALFAFFIGTFAFFIGPKSESHSFEWSISACVALFCTAVLVSMFVVERRRIRTAEADAAAAAAAAVAEQAQGTTPPSSNPAEPAPPPS